MPEFFVINNHNPPADPDEIRYRIRARGGCFNIHDVRWRHLLVLDGGAATLSHLAAPDAESVRIAMRHAGFDANRVWAVQLFDGHENVVPIHSVFELHLQVPVSDGELEAVERSLRRQSVNGGNDAFRLFLTTDRRHLFLFHSCASPGGVGVPLPVPAGAHQWLVHRSRQLTPCVAGETGEYPLS